MNIHIFFTKLSKHGLCGLFVTLLTLFILPTVSAQTNIFVSASASNDNGDGTTWATAKKTIAAGIAAAGSSGTVFVKVGIYNTTAEFTIPAGITVIGGYMTSSAGTDTSQRQRPGVNSRWQDASLCTIISGAGNHRIATVGGTLDGCVVRYGVTTTMGGGLLIDGGTVQYCVIMWCDAIEDDEFTAEGGGAYIRNNGTLLNCVVTECRGDNGSAVSGEDGTLINNTITRNWPSQCGTVTDYDGNTYHTVQIGSQCWMKENLRTTHYADGTAIPTTSGSSETVGYYYQRPNINVVQYGLLYNWLAAMHGVASSNSNPSGVQGACPDGWHLPSDAEWYILTGFVSSIPRYRCDNNTTYIAKALSGKTGWTNNTNSCYVGNLQSNNNATGFNGQPAGYHYDGSFYQLGNISYIWSSTENDSSTALYRVLGYQYATVNRPSYSKKYAYSIRCVKDLE